MEETVNERIQTLIEQLRLNPNSFAKKLDVATPVIYNIIGGKKNSPSYKLIYKICTIFHINGHWLLTGYGSMFLTGYTPYNTSIINEAYELYGKNQKQISLEILEDALGKLITYQDTLHQQHKDNLQQQTIAQKLIDELQSLINTVREK